MVLGRIVWMYPQFERNISFSYTVIFYHPPTPPPPQRDLMCGAGSLGSHSHTVNGLNKPEGGGADAFCAAPKEHFAADFRQKYFPIFQEAKVFNPFFIEFAWKWRISLSN